MLGIFVAKYVPRKLLSNNKINIYEYYIHNYILTLNG